MNNREPLCIVRESWRNEAADAMAMRAADLADAARRRDETAQIMASASTSGTRLIDALRSSGVLVSGDDFGSRPRRAGVVAAVCGFFKALLRK